MADQIQKSDAPIGFSTRLERADWWSFAVTALLTLSGYLLMLAPEVGLEWSGILTTGAMYGGVGPPAGYPVWTIYSWLFIELLPFSNPAWRVAVGSAVASALACGLVAMMVSRAGKMMLGEMPMFERLTGREQSLIRGISGYVAGMALGFSSGLWNEALIADYWAFTVLLFTLVIYLLMRLCETGRRRFCWLAFFVYGLLLTNSQELITALPGLVCAIMIIDRKLGRDVAFVVLPLSVLVTSIAQFSVWDSLSHRLNWPLLITFVIVTLLAVMVAVTTQSITSEWKSALACGAFLLLGLAAYLYLPIVATTNPPVNWSYPRTLEGFVHLISRGQFERSHPTDNLAVFGTQLWALVNQTGHEFGWLFLLFAALPFCCLRGMTQAGRKWMLALVVISVCIGPLLLTLLNLPTDRQSQALAEQFFYALRVPLALWTGMGLMLFATKVATPKRAGESVSA